ncbi:proteasome subunit beta type-7-like [Drosophila kikkawai]|uniref:Proteasome subunit beta type-7-like n=1 Tax=Drosophila kikkawai TaxID=30033 RepID=A0A6P4I5H7_DROKI|nr:proteasome subunit beta type-2-like [Drosophila kikkawai]
MDRLASGISNTCVSRKIPVPKIVVTDNIVVGIQYECGVIIATDVGPTISNMYRLHDNIYAAVTGVGQDICAVVSVIQSKLEMHHMTTNYRRVPVRCANQMAKQLLHSQDGDLNVNLLIAGVDKYGTEMYSTRFDGSSDTAPFTAMGTGTMNAMSLLETRWRTGLDEETARDVIREAVICGTGRVEGPFKSPIRLCILRNDYSMLDETIGSVVQPLRPFVSRVVPKIVGERVVMVESSTPENGGSGEESVVAKEKINTGGLAKIDEGGDK